MADRGSIEAGRGHVSLSVEKTSFEKGLEEAKKNIQSLGKYIAGFGATIAGVGAAIEAPFYKGLAVFSEMGSEISSAARQTGLGVQAVQRIAAGTGSSLDDLSVTFRKLSAFMHDVGQGTASSREQLARLGLTAADLAGKSPEEQFYVLADALERVGDMSLRAEILGRNAPGLNFSGGRAGIQTRIARREELGGFMGTQDEATARAYNKVMREFGIIMKGFWMTLGAVAAPVVTQIWQSINDVVNGVRKWMAENRPLLGLLFRLGGILVIVGSAITSVGGAIFGFGALLIAAKAAFVAIAGFFSMFGPALLIAVVAVGVFVAGIVGLFLWMGLFLSMFGATWEDLWEGAKLTFGDFVSALQSYFQPVIEVIQRIGATVSQTFGAIGDALSAGEFVLAGQIAWIGLQLVWVQGVNFLKDLWLSFKFFFLMTWDSALAGMVGATTGVFNALKESFIGITESIMSIVNAMIDRIPSMIRNQLGIQRLDVDVRSVVEQAGDGLARLANPANRQLEHADRTQERSLQGSLDAMAWQAEGERAIREHMAWINNTDLPVRPEMGSGGGAKYSSIGTFSSDAIAGMSGGSTPIDMVAQYTLRALDYQRRIADRLDEMEGLVAE